MKEKVFADYFQMNFLKEEDFLNFISEREANSYWKRYQSNELRFFALDNNIISNNIQYQLKESEIPVFEDTMKHTRLILKVTDKIYPVRSCAVKSILERAKVSGNALNKVEKIIQKMKQQPNGIRFEELKKVLVFYGYTMKSKTGTSHRNFINSKGDVITIKYENPLKAVYVKDVLKRINE